MTATAPTPAARLIFGLDVKTMTRVAKGEPPSVLRHADGRKLTADETALVFTATEDDMRTVSALKHKAAAEAEAAHSRAVRMGELLRKYAEDSQDTVGAILPRMSQADADEFRLLVAEDVEGGLG